MAGSIEQRGKNSWRLIVSGGYDADKKQITYRKTVKAKNKTEAKKFLNNFIYEIENKKLFNKKVELKQVTLAEFFEVWEGNFALEHHAPKTVENNRYLFSRINIAIGHKAIDEITPQHILAFYKNLQEPIKICKEKQKAFLSAETIKKHHVLLHSLFQKAIKWQMIKENPCDYVDAPKVDKVVTKVYEMSDTGKFLTLLNKENLKYQCMILLLITTGMRRGEVFGLEWQHVNFDKGEISIQQQTQYLSGRGTFTRKLKTLQSYRVVSVPDSVIFLIRAYKSEKEQYIAKKVQNGEIWHNSKRIFTTKDGKDAHPDSVNNWLKKFIKNNGLVHLTPKSFRHMAATYLITGGVDIRTVAGKLGHSNSTTTQKVYSHLLKSAEKETAIKINDVLNNAKKLYTEGDTTSNS